MSTDALAIINTRRSTRKFAPDAVRKLLGVPETAVPFACVPVGRPAGPAPRTGSRFDEKKVHRQAWGGR
jgi:hypothetical protein